MSGTVAIIGGAIVGSMTAFFLRQEGYTGRIVVLEMDPTYRFCSTALSAAGIRTQFGCPVNVQMSLFGASFLKTLGSRFGPQANIGFHERGYLVLGAHGTSEARQAAARMQVANGAQIAVLTPAQLAARYPWLNVGDVDVGTLGVANEGWYDAWLLLQVVRGEARRLGVEYLHAEAAGFDVRGARVTAVRTTAGATVPADWVVNASGPASGRVASWLGIPLPVTARKRTVFHFTAPVESGTMPMLFDTHGAWLRPERDGFIAGIAPPADRDPEADGDFEPDHAMFEEAVWPALAHRVPGLERLRLLSAWAGHYEVNALDQNGVVGPHHELANFLFASGFSGHGVMHAPATGRGVAELVMHGRYRTLDLGPLGYERVRQGRPMAETAIY